VRREGLLAAVPERVHKDLVVLDGDRVHRGADVEGAPLHNSLSSMSHGPYQKSEML